MRSIVEMDTLINELIDFEEQINAQKSILKELQEKEDATRRTIMAELEESGVDKFAGSGGTINIATRFAVKMPQGDVKDELRGYLNDKGVFDNLWTINYQSLNSWYKAEMEQSQADGSYLDVPGLSPTSDKYLQFRRSKK